MARIEVGRAIGTGFGLIRRRPLSVLTWGVLPAALQAVTLFMLAPIYVAMIGTMMHAAQAGGTPDTTAFASQSLAVSGLAQLLNLVQLLLSAVIYCAVFRAVLHPEKSSFAFMRVGTAELLLAVMIFGAVIALLITMLVVMIPVGIIVGIAAVASHGSAASLAVIIPLFILLIFAVMIFFGLRFAFVGPMMVDDGKFHLMESWRLSKGRVGSLFLIGLALFAIAIVLELILLAIVVAVGIAALGALAGGLQSLPAFFQQPPSALMSKLAPLLGFYLLAFIPISGCLVAVFGAPWASAYRDLKPDLAEAFA